MLSAQWVLEAVLVLLLGATLFHAVRLERALGVLKRDRAVLEELVEGFNESTRQAENGIERLRGAADGAGRQMARQIETAQRLRDDLSFLADRSDRLAERLETAVRAARMAADSNVLQGPFHAAPQLPSSEHQQGTQTGPRLPQPIPHREVRAPILQSPLLKAPVSAASSFGEAALPPSGATGAGLRVGQVALDAEPENDEQPRLRSQAERDLLRALRGAR